MQLFWNLLSLVGMRIKLFFLLLPVLAGNFAMAQVNVQVVKGIVVDADLETPLPGANVILTGSDPVYGTVTDANGRFKLEKVPLGRQNFQISLIGYETGTVKNVLVTAGKEIDLTIKLTESVTEMKEIVVEAEDEKGQTINQMAMVSARSFSVEETKRYAGSFDDPGRMAQSFAGVSSNNDNSNEIVIRGNSPRGVLWKMEGIEIPNPNHFANQGASGGAISMLSSNMMTNSDFFTGAFPGDYGNALSGVFDIHLRKGNYENREYAFQVGVLGTDFALEGPFKKGYTGSYLFNYRYSTLSMLNKIGINIVGDAIPVFQDMSFNVQLPTKKAGNFSVFGLGGNSKVSEHWEDVSNSWQSDFSLLMGILGVTHTYFVNAQSYIKTVLSVNSTINAYHENQYDSLGTLMYTDYRQRFENDAVRGTITYNNKLSSSSLLRVGVIHSQLRFKLFSEGWNEVIDQPVATLNHTGESGYSQAFVSWKKRATNKLTFQSGVHFLYFYLNNHYTVEPRMGMQWEITPRHSLNFGAGLHSRIEDLTVYMAQTNLPDGSLAYPNKNLGLTRAAHLVLGYNFNVNENFHIKPEIYYQCLFSVPIINSPTSSFSALNFSNGWLTDSLANKGTGRNIGIDLTAEKYFSNSWFFMYTGSLYQSTYVAGDGVRRNTRYNGNYASTLVGGKEFVIGRKKGKKNILSVSSRVNLAGGRRYTPVLLNASNMAGYEVLDSNKVFVPRQKDYFRIDFQISYKRNRKNTTRTWKIDMQNVINRKNIYGTYYDPKTHSIRTSYQMGFIPVISYKIEF